MQLKIWNFLIVDSIIDLINPNYVRIKLKKNYFGFTFSTDIHPGNQRHSI